MVSVKRNNNRAARLEVRHALGAMDLTAILAVPIFF